MSEGQCRKEVASEVSKGSVGGNRWRKVSKESVEGKCRRKVSKESVEGECQERAVGGR